MVSLATDCSSDKFCDARHTLFVGARGDGAKHNAGTRQLAKLGPRNTRMTQKEKWQAFIFVGQVLLRQFLRTRKVQTVPVPFWQQIDDGVGGRGARG